MATAQAMVRYGKQGVGIGWQINSDNVRFLVGHMIDETGVLVRETVVVLPPNMRGQQIVQRGDSPPPGDNPRYLQPFCVLVEHGIHNVDESFVAGEESVPA